MTESPVITMKHRIAGCPFKWRKKNWKEWGPDMQTPEQTIDIQRRTIEHLRNEVETLKGELEDFHELKRQKLVKQQVGYAESSILTQPFAATGLVVGIAGLAFGFYIPLTPGAAVGWHGRVRNCRCIHAVPDLVLGSMNCWRARADTWLNIKRKPRAVPGLSRLAI
jgi:hypothetical protein